MQVIPPRLMSLTSFGYPNQTLKMTQPEIEFYHRLIAQVYLQRLDIIDLN